MQATLKAMEKHSQAVQAAFRPTLVARRNSVRVVDPQFEAKFNRLTAQWKRESAVLSSPVDMALTGPYQRIIGMGGGVVPLILRELRREPDFWFWALRAVTGADPVPESSRGRVSEMTKCWLKWGREQGIRL